MLKIIRLWMLLCIVVVVMMGCAERDPSNAGGLGDSPPQPQIRVEGKGISVYQSSYCWTDTCVDYISPVDMLKEKHKEQVEADAQLTYQFDVESPTEVSLTQHHNGAIVRVALSGNTFQAPNEAGIYYYSLSARWLKDIEKRVSRGSSDYVFVIEVLEKKKVPTAEELKEEQAQEDQVQKELLLNQNFDSYVKLPENYYYGSFVMLNDREAVYAASKRDTDPLFSEVVKINLETKETWVMWEGTDHIRDLWIAGVPGYDRDSIVKFTISNYEKKTLQSYMIEDGELPREVSNQIESPSPDGQWHALSINNTQDIDQAAGIWGLQTTSNQKVQWTTEKWDKQPLWLPDSSGFMYLRDTGVQVGDGAGPAYELAYYDLRMNKSTVLPFEKGYWGGIEWLNPGKTIVVHTGFDDGFGYKIVDLLSQKEMQIFETTDAIEYVRQLINPITRRMLISEIGNFLFFNKEGELEKTVPWVTDLDEYTKINPDFGSEEWVTHPYYISGNGNGLGPASLEFSPDGTQLVYTLGLMWDSGNNIVPGNRIVISNEDGTKPVWLMKDYFRISELHWTPSSDRLIVHFGIPQSEGENYLGIIEMD